MSRRTGTGFSAGGKICSVVDLAQHCRFVGRVCSQGAAGSFEYRWADTECNTTARFRNPWLLNQRQRAQSTACQSCASGQVAGSIDGEVHFSCAGQRTGLPSLPVSLRFPPSLLVGATNGRKHSLLTQDADRLVESYYYGGLLHQSFGPFWYQARITQWGRVVIG